MAQRITFGKASLKFVSILMVCFSLLISLLNKPENKDDKAEKAKYLEQVSYLNVRIDDNFWGPKIKLNQVNGIRSVFKHGKSSLENFDIAAGKMKGEHDKRMAIDPDKRWTNIKKDHELYCAGHLFEAAVAYYEVTGKRKLLDAAKKFADHIDSIFGPGKRIEVPGHQEIELALFKLYKTTNNQKYLKLAEFFLNERGNPERIDTIRPDFDPYAGTPNRWRHPSYRQDHLPVDKQYHATGHAVRAVYMYSAITDLVLETKSERYISALDSIWNEIVTKKMYITAGIGTHEFRDEGFGTPYKLPNHSAYCESCSGMGFSFWNRRMNLLHGDARYADLVELLIYNAAISSVSQTGDLFFYRNPLESEGKYSRKPWFNPACCPSNMVRFLPEIGQTIYAKDENGIYINQFIGNEAAIQLKNINVNLKMKTSFPWEGKVNIDINPETDGNFQLYIRIPEWAGGHYLSGSDLYTFSKADVKPENKVVIKINGKAVRKPATHHGYVLIERKWQKNDHVELNFPMVPHGVFGHPLIEDTKGKVALMRGPVIYCLEEADNPEFFNQASEPEIQLNNLIGKYDENLLGGVVSIKSKAVVSENKNMEVRYIPYYSWANRGEGKMKVWAPFKTK